MVIPILIFLAVVLVYKKTENYGFLIDDIETYKRTQLYKPKTRLMFFAKHLRGTILQDNKVAHGFSIMVHAITSTLIYVAFGSNNISLLTALLFAFNPVNTQTTCWISGRGYMSSVGIILLGLIFKWAFPVLYPIGMYYGSINCVFAPLLFVVEKPHWFVLLLPLIWIINNKHRNAFKQRVDTTTPQMKTITWKRGFIVFKTIGYYFWHCLFPLRITMCHSYLHSYGIDDESTEKWYGIDGWFLLGIGLAVLSVVGFWIVPWKILYGVLWFMLFVIQWSNFVYINHPISERYIVLANVGVMLMLANILSIIPFGAYLAVGILVFYLTRLRYVMEQYKDLITFWKTNAEMFPDVGLAFNQWGIALSECGKIGSAVDTYVDGLKNTPEDFRLNYNLANVMACIGDPNIGIKHICIAERNVHKNSPNAIEMWKRHIDVVKKNCYSRGASGNVITANSDNLGVSTIMADGGKR